MASKNLKTILKDSLSVSELRHLVRSYDVIGDVAVVHIPPQLETHQHLIGKTLAERDGRIRVVAKRAGNYGGEFRQIRLQKIYGEGDLKTVHTEFGVRLHVDPSAAYFSPRSGVERYRLARCVAPGEHILVLFSGVAPIPLMLSLHSPAETIVGIEKNRRAHHYAQMNLAVNKKADNIELMEGDVLEVLPELKYKFDRIIMPLPTGAAVFLPLALSSLKKEGWLHFYDFQRKGEFFKSAKKLESAAHHCRRKIRFSEIHKCGHISPYKYRVCVDAQIE